MSMPLSRDFALYAAAAKPARHAAHPWPRMACFAAALIVSLGLWVALIQAVLRLSGW